MENEYSREINFARGLIRGKIAEVVFERMIREEKRYTVIPFGYEHTMPTLAQYQHLVTIKKVMDNIKDAPDFVLISEDKTKIFLVEVKYQAVLDKSKLVEYAEKLMTRWNLSWLFIATPKGFYCGSCSEIAASGHISKMSPNCVAGGRQVEYLKVMNEFKCDL